MTPEELEWLACHVESRNRGWISGGEIPPCRVYLDKKEVKNVRAVNRRKGTLRVYFDPLRLDKYRKKLLWYTVKGSVVLILKGD